MNNLFSSFDPSAWANLPLNWLSAFVVLLALPPFYWTAHNHATKFFSLLLNTVRREFQAMLDVVPASLTSVTFLSMAFFTFVVLNNVFGLVPYIFTASRHLTFALPLALAIWLGSIILSLYVDPNHTFAHLLPQGTPAALIPFIVLVEIVRTIIRPLTLAVRLAANMIAGHLLLTLLARQAVSLAWLPFVVLLGGLILLCTLECAVSLIQAYVFATLAALYVNDAYADPSHSH